MTPDELRRYADSLGYVATAHRGRTMLFSEVHDLIRLFGASPDEVTAILEDGAARGLFHVEVLGIWAIDGDDAQPAAAGTKLPSP